MTRLQRVLHVIPAIAPRYGGPSSATLGICRALGAAGTATLIATTDADGPGRLPLTMGEPVMYDGLPAIFFRRELSESFKWSPALARWARAHVHDFDLVHVHAVFSHSSVAAGRACRAARVPYVVRPLGTLDPWSLDRHPRRKRLMMQLGVGRLLTGASAIHYTAPEEQLLAETRLPWLARGVVAPLGVDDDLFELPSGGEREPVLVSIGRLDPKKGIDLLIRAFHQLAGEADVAGWRLVIAGDGSPQYVHSLQTLAREGPGRDRIEFSGWLGGSDRRQLLSTAALFALPSQQENFGIALVEALAAGVPAVVSPGVNLARDLVAAGAGWTTPREPAALASVLRSAMIDRSQLCQCSRNARAFAERFRWVRVAEGLQALYDEVLRSQTPQVRTDLRATRPV